MRKASRAIITVVLLFLCFSSFGTASTEKENSLSSQFGVQDRKSKHPSYFEMEGVVEAGITEGWDPHSLRGTFTVDQITLKTTFHASKKARLVLENAAAYAPAFTIRPSVFNDGANYLSHFRLSFGEGMYLANQQALFEHQPWEHFYYQVGHIRVPFGLESMTSRFDMTSYFYSTGYALAQAYEWTYDVGFKFVFDQLFPGRLEFSIVDGSRKNENHPRSYILRYSLPQKSGSLNWMPSASVYAGRLHGKVEDFALSAGFRLGFAKTWIHGEWIHTRQDLQRFGGPENRLWSVYVEPGIDLDFLELSLKGELVSADFPTMGSQKNRFNLGVSLARRFSDRVQIRLLYQYAGLQYNLLTSNFAFNANDVRLLFGTSF